MWRKPIPQELQTITYKPTGSVLLNFIKQRIYRSPKNVIVVVVGEPGSGKSNAGLKFLRNINPEIFEKKPIKDILHERVCFTPEDFIDRIDSGAVKKGDVIIFDEPQINYSSRSWYEKTNKLLNKVLTTYRHRQLITVFCTPSLSYLDSQARKVITLFVHCYDMNVIRGYVLAKVYKFKYNALEDKLYPNKIRFVDRADNTLKEIGAVKFSRLQPELEREYKELSNQFKREVTSDVKAKLKDEVLLNKDRPALDLMEKEVIRLKVEKHYTKQEISDELGVPISRITKAYNGLRQKGLGLGVKKLQPYA